MGVVEGYGGVLPFVEIWGHKFVNELMDERRSLIP